MQNHKRLFRFLLSLCLVCGCLVSFSSVNAFAATDHYYFDGYTVTSTDTTLGVKAVISVSSDKPYVEYEGLTGIGASESYAWYKGYVDDFYTVSITNTNDYPVISQFPFVSISATTNSPDTLTGAFNWYGDDGYSITLSEFNNCSVFTISEYTVAGYSGVNDIEIYPDTDRIDDLFIIQPHDTLTFSFKSTRCYNVSYEDITGTLYDAEVAIRNALQYANITNVSLGYEPTQSYYGAGSADPNFNRIVGNRSISKAITVNNENVGSFQIRYYTGYLTENHSKVNGLYSYENALYNLDGYLLFSNVTDKPLVIVANVIRLFYNTCNFVSANGYERLIEQPTFKLSSAYFPNDLYIGAQSVNEIQFEPTDNLVTNGKIVIMPNSTRTIPFNLIFDVNLVRDKIYNGVHWDISFFFNDIRYGNQSGSFNAIFDDSILSTDSSTNILAGEIESQTQQQQQQHDEQMQQQQQQHEEQMQQQQEQYEDLTDPAPEAGSDLVGGTEDEVKEKIGLFTFIDDLIQSMLGLFVPPEDDPVITFPGWSITIQGVSYQIWEDHTFNLASLDDDFSVLMTAVRFATIAVVYAAFLKFLVDTYNRIILGSDGD